MHRFSKSQVESAGFMASYAGTKSAAAVTVRLLALSGDAGWGFVVAAVEMVCLWSTASGSIYCVEV